MTYTRRRTCVHCTGNFAVDPKRPNARICVPCAEKHSDRRVRERLTSPPKPIICVPRGPSTPGQYSARTLLSPPGEWVSRARCKPEVAEFFWPLQGQSGGPLVEAALKLCSHCPVIRECGQWAIDNQQTEGIWGGMRPGALQRLAAKRRAGLAVEPTMSPGEAEVCANGHERNAVNVRVDRRGVEFCVPCRSAYGRMGNSKQRERQAAAVMSR